MFLHCFIKKIRQSTPSFCVCFYSALLKREVNQYHHSMYVSTLLYKKDKAINTTILCTFLHCFIKKIRQSTPSFCVCFYSALLKREVNQYHHSMYVSTLLYKKDKAINTTILCMFLQCFIKKLRQSIPPFCVCFSIALLKK